ncbi:PREDICTED: trypsin inhibitor-like [Habropoda laboriosa]|uniref:trypsin inhibitor-like n=1 Tax=Habropoda laboriosa TaxID=597456 RepID=UPI00083D837C|nr:PREDICTED: trypsin inhibitor-like [Habropoda laboriosa]
MNGKMIALFFATLCCALMTQEASAAVGPQCLLPLEHGPCKALMTRYGYNPVTNKCEEFMYGGCRGNENNFQSQDKCQEICS